MSPKGPALGSALLNHPIARQVMSRSAALKPGYFLLILVARVGAILRQSCEVSGCHLLTVRPWSDRGTVQEDACPTTYSEDSMATCSHHKGTAAVALGFYAQTHLKAQVQYLRPIHLNP